MIMIHNTIPTIYYKFLHFLLPIKVELDNLFEFLHEFPTLVGEQDALFPYPVLNILAVVERLVLRHPPKSRLAITSTVIDVGLNLLLELREEIGFMASLFL